MSLFPATTELGERPSEQLLHYPVLLTVMNILKVKSNCNHTSSDRTNTFSSRSEFVFPMTVVPIQDTQLSLLRKALIFSTKIALNMFSLREHQATALLFQRTICITNKLVPLQICWYEGCLPMVKRKKTKSHQNTMQTTMYLMVSKYRDFSFFDLKIQ